MSSSKVNIFTPVPVQSAKCYGRVQDRGPRVIFDCRGGKCVEDKNLSQEEWQRYRMAKIAATEIHTSVWRSGFQVGSKGLVQDSQLPDMVRSEILYISGRSNSDDNLCNYNNQCSMTGNEEVYHALAKAYLIKQVTAADITKLKDIFADPKIPRAKTLQMANGFCYEKRLPIAWHAAANDNFVVRHFTGVCVGSRNL